MKKGINGVWFREDPSFQKGSVQKKMLEGQYKVIKKSIPIETKK
jgi:hypothetical protein